MAVERAVCMVLLGQPQAAVDLLKLTERQFSGYRQAVLTWTDGMMYTLLGSCSVRLCNVGSTTHDSSKCASTFEYAHAKHTHSELIRATGKLSYPAAWSAMLLTNPTTRQTLTTAPPPPRTSSLLQLQFKRSTSSAAILPPARTTCCRACACSASSGWRACSSQCSATWPSGRRQPPWSSTSRWAVAKGYMWNQAVLVASVLFVGDDAMHIKQYFRLKSRMLLGVCIVHVGSYMP